MKLVLLSLPLALIGPLGCVDTSPATGSLDQGLVNAPVDQGDAWAVGVCAGPLNEDPAAGPIGACLTPETRCTGSLIAPDLVLTARHCVHVIDWSQATDFCSGSFTTTPITDAPVHVTTSLSVLGDHPSWELVDEILYPDTHTTCDDDVVLLRLHHAYSRHVARPVAVDLRDLVGHAPREVAVVGRGVIDVTFDTTDYSQISIDDGGLMKRKLEHIPFECVSDSDGGCVSPDIGGDFAASSGYLMFGNSTLPGDSGSGVLRQASYTRGRPQIVGVTSAGTADPVTGKPNTSFATRLDIHRAFIQGALHHCGHDDLVAASESAQLAE